MIHTKLADIGTVPSSPIVVINTAHSGSRLLARLLIDAGVYMGTNLNDSLDCLEFEPLVMQAVMAARSGVPRGEELESAESRRIAETHFRAHLQGRSTAERWGWKLCETLLIAPLIDRYFPGAVFVHLIRDGRDVALSPFVAPKAAYWRKVYFGTDAIRSWHGYTMTQRAYRARGHLFNAQRWRYHVDLARNFGATLCDRYIEVRYEDLVLDYEKTVDTLFSRLKLAKPAGATAALPYASSVGKWKKAPRRTLRDISALVEPTLTATGYAECTEIPPVRNAGLFERLRFANYIRA